jgi:hypothetical protein
MVQLKRLDRRRKSRDRNNVDKRDVERTSGATGINL